MLLNDPRWRSVWPWLSEMRFAGLALGVIALAFFVVLGFQTEPSIRLAGLSLQLLGICTVAWGISETRAFFGRPSLASQFMSWLSGVPLRRRDVALAAGCTTLAQLGMHGRAYVTQGPGSNPTVETRLTALEKNIELIHERITETQTEMDSGLRAVGDSISAEKESRLTEFERMRQKLEAVGTGGLHISAVGACWLFVGTTLSTAAVEIAAWLK